MISITYDAIIAKRLRFSWIFLRLLLVRRVNSAGLQLESRCVPATWVGGAAFIAAVVLLILSVTEDSSQEQYQ